MVFCRLMLYRGVMTQTDNTQSETDRERRNAALRDVAAGAAGGLIATVTAGTGILPALAVAAGTASVVAFLEANKLLGKNGSDAGPPR
jgi:hypothetical protein